MPNIDILLSSSSSLQPDIPERRTTHALVRRPLVQAITDTIGTVKYLSQPDEVLEKDLTDLEAFYNEQEKPKEAADLRNMQFYQTKAKTGCGEPAKDVKVGADKFCQGKKAGERACVCAKPSQTLRAGLEVLAATANDDLFWGAEYSQDLIPLNPETGFGGFCGTCEAVDGELVLVPQGSAEVEKMVKETGSVYDAMDQILQYLKKAGKIAKK